MTNTRVTAPPALGGGESATVVIDRLSRLASKPAASTPPASAEIVQPPMVVSTGMFPALTGPPAAPTTETQG